MVHEKHQKSVDRQHALEQFFQIKLEYCNQKLVVEERDRKNSVNSLYNAKGNLEKELGSGRVSQGLTDKPRPEKVQQLRKWVNRCVEVEREFQVLVHIDAMAEDLIAAGNIDEVFKETMRHVMRALGTMEWRGKAKELSNVMRESESMLKRCNG